MPTSEADYVVTTACYVPVGDGHKFKRPGQVVSLSKKAANALDGFVEPADESSTSPAPKKAAAKAEAPASSEVVGPPLDTPREDADGG